jgi:quercetin dioxygenase-like cupin family protein
VFRIHTKDLPFDGGSHEFLGADCGDVAISAFVVDTPQGSGPGPHRHPCDEVVFVQSGLALWTINGEEQHAGPGEPLVQLDIHLDREFQQEDLASYT